MIQIIKNKNPSSIFSSSKFEFLFKISLSDSIGFVNEKNFEINLIAGWKHSTGQKVGVMKSSVIDKLTIKKFPKNSISIRDAVKIPKICFE